MIIYAVILETDESLGGQLEDYMRSKHIPDVLATGCFSGAELARCGGGVYRISYRARNPESLEEYLAEHTQGLRKSFSAEFPHDIDVRRELLEVVDLWAEA